MIYTTQAELDAGLAKWQKILRLQDWELSASLVKPSEIDCNWGRNCIIFQQKRAVIKISTCEADDEGVPHDQEHTLVHEIRHVLTQPLFQKLDKDDFLYDLAEQDVDVTSKMLVTLVRERDSLAHRLAELTIAQSQESP